MSVAVPCSDCGVPVDYDSSLTRWTTGYRLRCGNCAAAASAKFVADAGKHGMEAAGANTPWQQQLFGMLIAPMQCTVVLVGGTYVTGELERFRHGLRMVSPDNCPGYLPENAPSPTCERFFDYKDVVMVTRRLT